MKEKINNLLSLLGVFIFIYLVINVLHLSWYIANPEGFFGFSYFIEIVRTSLLVLLLLAICLFGIWYFLYTLLSLLKRKSSIKDLIKPIGIIVFILIMTIFNSVWAGGLSFFISFELADKYSLINKTDDYLNDGKIDKAFKLAVKSYDKENNRHVGWVFALTKLYSLTDFDKKQKLFSKYEATINYGYCLKQTLEKDNGEKLFKEAILLANSPLLHSEQKNLLIFPTLSLAEINFNRQNYKVSDKYFEEFYDVFVESESEDTKQIINTYLMLAEKASRVGDFKKATKLYTESLELYEKSELSKESSNYLSLLTLASIGELYNENYTNASRLLLKCAPIAEEKEDKPVYLDYLMAKAQYCLLAGINNQGNEDVIAKSFTEKLFGDSNKSLKPHERMIKESEKCYIELVEKTKDIAGKNSYDYLYALIKLGDFYYVNSQFKMANKLFDKALALIEPIKDDNKDLYYDIYLKSLKIKNIDRKIDISKLDEFEDFIFNNLNSIYLILTEEEKEKYVLHLQKQMDFINSFYVTADSDLSRKRLYDNIISFKNVALSSNSVLRDYIRNSNNDIKSAYYKLLNEKKQLSMSSESLNNLKKAERIKVNEKELLAKIYSDPKFERFAAKSIDWTTIRDTLRENEVTIEIINLPISKYPNKDKQYYALLIKPGLTSPILIKLFKESELEDLLNVKGDTKTSINIIYDLNKKKLFDLVMLPIEKYLSDNSVIYLSKSGTLHNISMSGLLKDKNWDVFILGNTRQITSRSKLKKTDKVELFGDIDYNLGVDTISEGSRSNEITNFKYKNLKHTKYEVESIGKLFSNYEGKSSEILTGINASEAAFRKISGTKTDIIHLATHGSYKVYDFNSNLFNSNQFESTSLLRSELALAGANSLDWNTSDNDGKLTSLEISELDFSNVDLVVLSACKTGLGDVLGSEGVFGLQRAFKIAGAKSLIVSLWQVPDKQTSELMYKFYSYYLSGDSKKESLDKAQREIRDTYPNPYFWAGFELIE